METEVKTTETATVKPATTSTGSTSVHGASAPRSSNFRNDRSKTGGRRGPERAPRAKPEFEQKMLNIRRVTRVASGGRRFQFSVALIAGNKRGQVGVGLGKAGDTSLAIDKALRSAKKHMITVGLNKKFSIPHEVEAKYSSAVVVLRPAPGRGIVAGSALRNVLELAGAKDISAKILSGSKNKLNIARAAIQALSSLRKVEGPVYPKKVEEVRSEPRRFDSRPRPVAPVAPKVETK